MKGHQRSYELASQRQRGWRDALKCVFGFSAVVAMMSAALYAGSGERLHKFAESGLPDKTVAP